MTDFDTALFSFCALFVILIIQQSYEDALFEASLTFIPKIQEGATD